MDANFINEFMQFFLFFQKYPDIFFLPIEFA